MEEILSRFPDIAEDIFESLDDESLVHCKEASRSISSFMEEDTKFWKRIIRKLHKKILYSHSNFKKSWEILMDMKQTRPEMIKELGRAVQHYLNRHEGLQSGGKCCEASLFEGRKEACSHRFFSLSPLHVAAEAGNTLLYKFIVAHLCLETPLELATREGHLQVCEVMMSFMDKNPKSKMRHCKSWTPLHIAAVYGHLEICNAIMKQTADKNPVDSKGWTPLHCAAQEGHIQIIKAIHNHVVDKNPVDKEGLTPMALFLRHANAEDDMNDIIWE